MKRREQQGVALVVTLILLAIITIVVVAFLGVTQRNRALTSTATDQINAQFMADAGLERAQAEVAARLLSQPEPGPVPMLVSIPRPHCRPAGS
jgi:Tfp pilus assembly protein PilX